MTPVADFPLQMSNADSQNLFGSTSKVQGNKDLVISLVAHTLERKPAKATSMAGQRPSPPKATGSVA